jgi:hypothetical protein
VNVFLWDADGPKMSSAGVRGTFDAACHAAEACLASGQAAVALVEEARVVMGSDSLTRVYLRTREWRPSRGAGGAISWQRAS